MARLRWLALAVLVVLPQCRGGEGEAMTPRDMAVLDVVVDSLPFVIRQTWGMEDDQPYTALLSSAAPTRWVSDPPQQPGRSEHPVGEHPHEWLVRQAAKEHVVGTCSPDSDGTYCDFALSTVVATISRARFTPDGDATVEVALGRRDFGAITQLTLGPVGTSWEVVGFEIIVIS